MRQHVSDALPHFTYNANPKESFEESSEACASCNQTRGYIYKGPIYGNFDDEPTICPWCIKDGSAFVNLNVTFVVDVRKDDDSEEEVVLTNEFETCTPGFNSWQQGEWWTHCHDAAVYHGLGGKLEIESIGGQDGLNFFRNIAKIEYDIETEEEQDDFLNECGEDSDTTAYIFKCRSCGCCGGYIDAN